MKEKINRAAQFMPFDALKGLQQALREREEKMSRVSKKELTEEQNEQISCKLNLLGKGDYAEVIYYLKGHYLSLGGRVTEINAPYKYLVILNRKIPFSEIYKISLGEGKTD